LQISILTLKGLEEGFGVDSWDARSSGEIRWRLTLKPAEVRRKHQVSVELVTLARLEEMISVWSVRHRIGCSETIYPNYNAIAPHT
jgi:hypothetical protein